MAEVSVTYLPSGEGGRKVGVDDFLKDGHTVEDLLRLSTDELREPPKGEEDLDEPDTQSAVLVRYAEEADLFHTPDGEAYATFPVEEHRETHSIKSKGLRLWLVRRFHEGFGKPPGSQALQDALGVLEAKALFDGEEHPVHVGRAAVLGGATYVDLSNDSWEAVEITNEGWRVVSDPPCAFGVARA